MDPHPLLRAITAPLFSLSPSPSDGLDAKAFREDQFGEQVGVTQLIFAATGGGNVLTTTGSSSGQALVPYPAKQNK